METSRLRLTPTLVSAGRALKSWMLSIALHCRRARIRRRTEKTSEEHSPPALPCSRLRPASIGMIRGRLGQIAPRLAPGARLLRRVVTKGKRKVILFQQVVWRLLVPAPMGSARQVALTLSPILKRTRLQTPPAARLKLMQLRWKWIQLQPLSRSSVPAISRHRLP